MTDYGLVSIITPSYNSAQFIAETIESVLAQTYMHWELLITDDCSTDDTCAIVKRYAEKDNRIKLLRLSTNSGAGVARNNSIERAQGRYIAFCDSDDLWTKDKLEKQIAFMMRNNYDFSFSWIGIINVKDQLIRVIKTPKRVSYTSTLICNRIGTTGVVYDAKKLGKFYFKPIRKRQDWLMWLELLKKCSYAYSIDKTLELWRKRNDSISSNKKRLFKYHIEVYKILGYSSLQSYLLFYFVSLPLIIIHKIVMEMCNIKYIMIKDREINHIIQ